MSYFNFPLNDFYGLIQTFCWITTVCVSSCKPTLFKVHILRCLFTNNNNRIKQIKQILKIQYSDGGLLTNFPFRINTPSPLSSWISPSSTGQLKNYSPGIYSNTTVFLALLLLNCGQCAKLTPARWLLLNRDGRSGHLKILNYNELSGHLIFGSGYLDLRGDSPIAR